MRNRDECDVDGMRQVYPVWLCSATATCNGGIGPGRERFPRTALAHCIVLLLTGQLDQARKQYAALAARRRAALGNAAGEDMDYLFDETNVRGMLCLCGCERLASEELRAVVADEARLAAMDEVNPLTRGAFEQGLCIYHNLKAEFDVALDRAERAER